MKPQTQAQAQAEAQDSTANARQFDMANAVTALGAGLLFGLGLIVSGMINPSKVIGFLDLAGNWDPSLIFVMGGV